MTVKEFADIYKLSKKTVQRYCNQGKIDDAEKRNGVWVIPDDAIKPLKDKQIRQMLFTLILFKNDTSSYPDFTTAGCGEKDIPLVFNYLSKKNYILGFKKEDGDRIPFNTHVSKKGIEYLFKNKNEINWTNLFIEYGIQFLPLVFETILKTR